MLKKRNTESFTDEIAKEFGLSKKQVNKILVFGMKNVCRLIARGEDIHLNHFGRFYFEKKHFARYLKKARDEARKRRQNTNRPPGQKS